MIKRDIEYTVEKLKSKYQVIVITGPRQSGKTTLSKKLFPSIKYTNLEEIDIRDYAKKDPRGFLKYYGNNLIIDEIQRVPELLSYIQVEVDSNKKSFFVLTGSNQFEMMSGVSQSLAGRCLVLKLLPFSINELKEKYKKLDSDTLILKGFYPRIYDKKIEPSVFYSSYVSTYLERDLRLLINIKDLYTFQRFLKICAGRIGSIINLESIANDVGVSHTTIRAWLNILEASYIIFFLQPFYKNLSKRLIKSPKLYFYDVGLCCYLLGIENKEQLFRDPLRGALFENLVISEFLKLKYNSIRNFNMFFYRDSNGTEVDLFIQMGSKIIPFEIKSSKTFNEDFAKNIKKTYPLFKKEYVSPSVIYDGNFEQIRGDLRVINFLNIKSYLE
jgi:predicted AAA+ superfamily ATPase